MALRVSDAIRALRDLAPESWAEEWDNVGLQFGREDRPIARVMTCLDADDPTIDAAADAGVDLLVAHHPVIFRPPRTLREDRPEGRLIARLIRLGIAFYACHTNFDVALGGTNDALADALGVTDTRPLVPGPREKLFKLAVFTPVEAVPAVLRAMAAAGAGAMGRYSHCTFRAPGTGTYRPLDGANPYRGEAGRIEEVEEQRVEAIVPPRLADAVIDAVRAAHPYEAMAYDLYPLENAGPEIGIGRIGTLSASATLGDFAAQVRERLGASSVEVVGDPERTLSCAALCGGSGGKFIEAAHGAGADVYVTSEVGHHQRLLARSLDLALVEASHAATEAPVVPRFAAILRAAWPGLEVIERMPAR